MGKVLSPTASADKAWRESRANYLAITFFSLIFSAVAWWWLGERGTHSGPVFPFGTLGYALILIAAVELASGHFGLTFLRRWILAHDHEVRPALRVEGMARLFQWSSFLGVALLGLLLATFRQDPLWAWGGTTIAISSLVAVAPRLENFREITRREAAGQDPWAKH